MSRSTFKHRALRSPIMTIHDIRLRQPLTTTASALQRRKTLNIEASKPTLGSEIGLEPRETAQTRNIRYQGGPGCRSYASIPRGLRCEPWSGRAEDIGMNGDNRLHLGVICRQSVEEAVRWFGCMCVDVHRTLDRLRTSASGSGHPARHADAVGASARACFTFCAPGLILRHVDGRWTVRI